jgi:hypothetical protein
MIRTARFGPDYQTVLYGALWDGDVARVYTVRPEGPESTALPLPPAVPLAVSSAGELALSLGAHFRDIMTYGTLARAPVAGGAPRELEKDIKYADWSPDGQQLAIVRSQGDGDQLEFPMGQVIAEPTTAGAGYSCPRFAARRRRGGLRTRFGIRAHRSRRRCGPLRQEARDLEDLLQRVRTRLARRRNLVQRCG